MIKDVQNNLEKIKAACQEHGVISLYLFGSAATGEANAASDIDFLIKYKRDDNGLAAAAFDYFDFLFLLEDITGRKVDLVVNEAVHNKYFIQQVDKQKLLIYAA
jgi:uncharacterized protein